MPKPYPSEFREEVVRVARNREPGVTIEQIARDFGGHAMTLQKWLQRAAVDNGSKPGQSRTESAENRELWKRIRLLEHEVEVLRRAAPYLSQANLPGITLDDLKEAIDLGMTASELDALLPGGVTVGDILAQLNAAQR